MGRIRRSLIRALILGALALLISAGVSFAGGMGAAYAENVPEINPNNVRWSGLTAVWDRPRPDRPGIPFEYKVSVYDCTDGTELSLGETDWMESTSYDLENFLNGKNLTDRTICFKVQSRYYASSIGYKCSESIPSVTSVVIRRFTFNSNGGSDVQSIIVPDGSTWRYNTDPTRDGYWFAGWYKTNTDFESDDNIWDFGRDKTSSSMTLYAKWIEDGTHVHFLEETSVSFKPWSRLTTLPTEGSYYLLHDVNLASGDTVTASLNLCLAGHTVTCGNHQIKVPEGKMLNLCDAEGGGKITGAHDVNGAIYVCGGSFTMHSGCITGNSTEHYSGDYRGIGGGVRVEGNTATARMLGGSITNNTAYEFGGGVGILSGGTFELAGGSISGNTGNNDVTANQYGAGVGVATKGIFIMSGGTITENRISCGFGSAIYAVNSSTVYLHGGTITGNSGGNSAVYINDLYDASIQISKDGTKTNTIIVKDNSSGNIRFNSTGVIKVNGEIDENSVIGFTPVNTPGQGGVTVYTEGLSGNGAVSLFKCDNGNYAIVDENGEAAIRNNWLLTYQPGDHSNGGTMDPAAQRVIDEENLTLPECAYTATEGYEFVGWKANNAVYQPGDALKVTGKWDVTATWKAIDYPIEYDLDGGAMSEGAANPSSHSIESSDIALAAPERTGYTFVGWTRTDIEGDTPAKDVTIPAGSLGARSYKANWEVIEYTISYRLNGGKLEEGETNPAKYTVEDEFTLNEPERDGFNFLGWLGTGLEEETKNVTIEKGTIGNKNYIAIFEEMCKDGHTMTHHVAVNATSSSMGNIEYWTCDNCGRYFIDANGQSEVDAKDVVITIPDYVKGLINAIPNDPTTPEGEAAVKAAREAYDALTDDQKDMILYSTLKKLTDAEKKLAVLKAVGEVSGKSGIVYTGIPVRLINTPSTALPAGYTMKYAVTTEDTAPTDEAAWSTSVPTRTEAGIYYVWYKVVGDVNHNDAEPAKVAVTVGKADSPVTVGAAAAVTRGGNTVDLAKSVKLNGATGTVSYKISGAANGCKLAGSVLTTGTGTGSVTVNVTVAADDNYKALAATPITVTIGKRGAQTITAENVTVTYGESGKRVSATTDGDGKLSYAVKSGNAVTVDAASGALTIVKAGTATIIVKASETAACEQATKDVTVTVNKAASTVAAPTAKALSYNGSAQALVIAGSTKDGKMQYAIGTKDAATEAYSASIPSRTDAGTYYVWYYVKGDGNHLDTKPDKLVAVIGGAAVFGMPDFTLPASIQKIEANAFEGASMTVVYVPDSCAAIGAEAFKDCTKLKQIRLPKDCAIEASVFDGCGLVYVFAPAGGRTQAWCAKHQGVCFIARDAD